MTVVFKTTETREFKFGVDIDGNEFAELASPTTAAHALECFWCDKVIRDKKFWVSLNEAEIVCVKCVEG